MMIVWVKGNAVKHPCNQRARVVEVWITSDFRIKVYHV